MALKCGSSSCLKSCRSQQENAGFSGSDLYATFNYRFVPFSFCCRTHLGRAGRQDNRQLGCRSPTRQEIVGVRLDPCAGNTVVGRCRGCFLPGRHHANLGPRAICDPAGFVLHCERRYRDQALQNGEAPGCDRNIAQPGHAARGIDTSRRRPQRVTASLAASGRRRRPGGYSRQANKERKKTHLACADRHRSRRAVRVVQARSHRRRTGCLVFPGVRRRVFTSPRRRQRGRISRLARLQGCIRQAPLCLLREAWGVQAGRIRIQLDLARMHGLPEASLRRLSVDAIRRRSV
jgi:hypothetical protein